MFRLSLRRDELKPEPVPAPALGGRRAIEPGAAGREGPVELHFDAAAILVLQSGSDSA